MQTTQTDAADSATTAALQLRLRQSENPLSHALYVPGQETLSDEQMALCQLAQIQDGIKQMTEWADELKAGLLNHYRATGEKPFVPNGPSLEIRSRTTYKYDDAAIQSAKPALFKKVAKVDGTKVAALIKGGGIKESDIEEFRIAETTEFVQVGKPK